MRTSDRLGWPRPFIDVRFFGTGVALPGSRLAIWAAFRRCATVGALFRVALGGCGEGLETVSIFSLLAFFFFGVGITYPFSLEL